MSFDTDPVMERTTLSDEDLYKIIEARHEDPFRILGPHKVFDKDRTGIAVRAFLPGAEKISILVDEEEIPMAHIHREGFFEGWLDPEQKDQYRLRCYRPGGVTWDIEDPYRFSPILGEVDVYLHSEGTHLRSYEKLGAHICTHEGIQGTHFAVWAPSASRVSVVGSFNDWDGRRNPLRFHGHSGLWEIFLPGTGEGDLYKFEIRTQSGDIKLKADPYGFRYEFRPGTASVVHDLGRYGWKDSDWLEQRTKSDFTNEPISIYEVHLGSWRRPGDDGTGYLNYRDIAHQLGDYVIEMGFTHVEILPAQEHPFDGSWGYQPIGYFAPTSRFGSPDDFKYFIDHLHQRGIGVILDWVPAHFPRDDHGLREFDGTCLYEHADPRQGEHLDWGTLIFNYGRHEVRNFLLASALFWIEEYHLDGIRVDAVASMIYLDYSKPDGGWVPNKYGGNENLEAVQFLKDFNAICHREHPGILTIAEESTSWAGVSRPLYLGGMGFSMKWNMGWMNDSLYYFERDPVHRKYHHQSLTFSLLYAFSENFVLPLSHDEVVHGKRSLLDKMPGDSWQKFANLRLLFAYQYLHPGKKLTFMGGEFGQGKEWNYDQSLDWHLLDLDCHRGLQHFVKDLNHLYRDQAAIHEEDFGWKGFEWIDFHDWENSIISFRRRTSDGSEEAICVFNFTPIARSGYRIGVPKGGSYKELLNSDASYFGGSGAGNMGNLQTESIPSHGLEHSILTTLPPLAALVFKRED